MHFQIRIVLDRIDRLSMCASTTQTLLIFSKQRSKYTIEVISMLYSEVRCYIRSYIPNREDRQNLLV